MSSTAASEPAAAAADEAAAAASAAAEQAAAEAAAAVAKLGAAGPRVHTAIGFLAITNAFVLPMGQLLTQQCTHFLWYNECDVDFHTVHLALAVLNLILMLYITTAWDPTNEARANVHAFLTALPNLFGKCGDACKDKCLAKLPLPSGIRQKLGLPPSGSTKMDDSDDDSEEEDESDSGEAPDEEKAAPPTPAPAPAPAERQATPEKKKGGLFKKGSFSNKLPPAAEKLPAPSPESKATRKDVKQIA